MEVLKIIFYILGLIPILYEFHKISDPKHHIRLYKDIKNNRKAKKPLDLNTEDTLTMYMGMFEFIWCTIGLFTFQWPVFVFLYITSILLSIIPKRPWIMFIDGIMTVLLIVGIMVNSRLKIDIVEKLLILTL